MKTALVMIAAVIPVLAILAVSFIADTRAMAASLDPLMALYVMARDGHDLIAALGIRTAMVAKYGEMTVIRGEGIYRAEVA